MNKKTVSMLLTAIATSLLISVLLATYSCRPIFEAHPSDAPMFGLIERFPIPSILVTASLFTVAFVWMIIEHRKKKVAK